MMFETERIADILIVKPLMSRITFDNYKLLKQEFFQQILHSNFSFLLMNLSQVEHIDSACIGMLLKLGLNVIKFPEKKFGLCCLHTQVKKTAGLANIDKLFPIFTSQHEAIQKLLKESEASCGEIFYIGDNLTLFNLLRRFKPNTLSITQHSQLPAAAELEHLIALFIEESHFSETLLNDFKTLLDKVPLFLFSENAQIIKPPHGIFRVFSQQLTEMQASTLMLEVSKLLHPVPTTSFLPPKLYETYLFSIPQKIEELQGALQAAACESGTEKIQELRNAVHKLSGSAGTYGFVQAGEACRKLSEELEVSIAQKTSKQVFEKAAKSIQDIHFYFSAVIAPSHAAYTSLAPIQKNIVVSISSDPIFIMTMQQAAALGEFLHINLDSPHQAIAQLQGLTFRPEFLLLDQEVDSNEEGIFQLLKEIRSHFCTKQMKIWTLLKSNEIHHYAQATEFQSDLILTKPVSAEFMSKLLLQHNVAALKRPINVLILDDDLDLCEWLLTCLNEVGIEAKYLTDSSRLLHNLEEQHFDLLLIDIHLPQYDGWTLLDILRRDVRFKKTKVVIITADRNLSAKKHLLYEGIWYKPLDKAAVQKQLLSLASDLTPSSDYTNQFTSSFIPQKEFQSLIQLLLQSTNKNSELPFYFVVLKSLDYRSRFTEKQTTQYLLECEQSLSSSLPKEYLKSYLGNGYFGLFAGWQGKQTVEAIIKEYIARSEYKIAILDTDIYTSFSAIIVESNQPLVSVPDLVEYAITSFEKMMVLHSEARMVIYSIPDNFVPSACVSVPEKTAGNSQVPTKKITRVSIFNKR